MAVGRKDIRRGRAAGVWFVAGLVTTPLFALSGAARADNMMSACEADIAVMCDGVSQGRGRISACLYSNNDSLAASCRAEVAVVSNSRTFQRYLPSGAKSLQGSEQEAGLRAACTADVDKVCSGVKRENGRFLACVYSRSDSVSEGCWAAAKTILQ